MNKLCKHGITLILLLIIYHSFAIYTMLEITPLGIVLIAPGMVLTCMSYYTYKTNLCCDISNIVKENKP